MGVHKNPKWVGGKRKGSGTLCSPPPPPAFAISRPRCKRPRQLGCLLPAGLEVVREKGTEPLALPFPLFVVSWRAIGCCL